MGRPLTQNGFPGRARTTMWASGGVVNAIELGIAFGYLLFFLTQVLLIPPAMAGTILLAARIWDVATDPIMGWVVDRTRGRVSRRTWVLLGSLLLAVLFPFMFLVSPDWSIESRVGLFTLAYILANTASTVFAIPHASLVTAISPPEGRSMSMGWAMTWMRVGLLLVGLGAPLAFNLTDDLRQAFAVIGFACGAVVLVVGLVVFASVSRDPPATSAPGLATPWQSLGSTLACRPLRHLLTLQLMKNSAMGCATSSLVFFITIVLEGPIELVGIFGTVTASLAALLLPAWVLLSARVDLRRMMAIGLGIMALCLAGYMLLRADWPGITLAVPFVGLTLSGGIAAYLLIALVNTVGDSAVNYVPAALVPDANEWRRLTSGQDLTGSSFAGYSLVSRLGFAAGGFVAAMLMDSFGFVSGAAQQEPSALLGVSLAAAGIPALILLACIPVVLLYPRRSDLLAGKPIGSGRVKSGPT